MKNATPPDRALPRELFWALGASGGLTATIIGVGFLFDVCLCSSALISWGLVSAGILGTYLASRDVAWGWLLLVGLQPLWVAYALVTEQYGFIAGALAYGVGQMNGFLRARRASLQRACAASGQS